MSDTRSRARRVRRRRQRWLRIRAVLASGLVLGVGAAGTLAAWNDAEHAQATFQAGSFGVEGAAGSDAYAEHATSGTAATLAFSASPGAMVPGAKTYAGFRVRTIAGSVAGRVQLASAGVTGDTGLGGHLTYGVRVITTATSCDAAAFAASGNVVVSTGTVLTAASTTWQALGAGGASGGAAVTYCFEITLRSDAPDAAQGKSATPTWTFSAENT